VCRKANGEVFLRYRGKIFSWGGLSRLSENTVRVEDEVPIRRTHLTERAEVSPWDEKVRLIIETAMVERPRKFWWNRQRTCGDRWRVHQLFHPLQPVAVFYL
jgi:hypothetical protein